MFVYGLPVIVCFVMGNDFVSINFWSFLGYFFIFAFFSVTLHEAIHWLCAKLLGLNPHFSIRAKGVLAVHFKNVKNDYKNLFVALSAPIILIVVAILLPISGIFVLLKMMFILNVLNLTPLTNDGQIILLSLLNIWRKK